MYKLQQLEFVDIFRQPCAQQSNLKDMSWFVHFLFPLLDIVSTVKCFFSLNFNHRCGFLVKYIIYDVFIPLSIIFDRSRYSIAVIFI